MTVNITADASKFVEAMDRATEAFRGLRTVSSLVAEAFQAIASPWSKLPARQRREQRRAEAAERQARYDATPTFDKLAAIAERRGESRRERERLLAAV